MPRHALRLGFLVIACWFMLGCTDLQRFERRVEFLQEHLNEQPPEIWLGNLSGPWEFCVVYRAALETSSGGRHHWGGTSPEALWIEIYRSVLSALRDAGDLDELGRLQRHMGLGPQTPRAEVDRAIVRYVDAMIGRGTIDLNVVKDNASLVVRGGGEYWDYARCAARPTIREALGSNDLAAVREIMGAFPSPRSSGARTPTPEMAGPVFRFEIQRVVERFESIDDWVLVDTPRERHDPSRRPSDSPSGSPAAGSVEDGRDSEVWRQVSKRRVEREIREKHVEVDLATLVLSEWITLPLRQEFRARSGAGRIEFEHDFFRLSIRPVFDDDEAVAWVGHVVDMKSNVILGQFVAWPGGADGEHPGS